MENVPARGQNPPQGIFSAGEYTLSGYNDRQARIAFRA